MRLTANYPVLLLIYICILLMLPASAQVANDDIEKRIKLPINASPFASNTTNCTVEWKSVDTKAVHGCIKFHNDQWFEFTTQGAGQYYVTVTNQQCRDIRGVQVMVVDGNPGDPGTYKYLVCHSTGAQDDIALVLDNLQANHTYLINIDGYLNDFCQFDISIRTQAPVFTYFAPSVEIPVTSQLTDSLVHLQWTLPDSLQEEFSEFYILKRHAAEKKSREVVRLGAVSNAYGERQVMYSYTDTVSARGVYTYKIIGSSHQQQNFLVNEQTVYYDGYRRARASTENLLTLEIPIRRKLNLSILIFDATTNELLKKGYVMTSAKNKNEVKIDVTKFIASGIRHYRVHVQEVDDPQGYAKSFLFTR